MTKQFDRSLENPEIAQEAKLLELVSRNAGSHYGKNFAFERIRSVAEFQERVPIRNYEDFRPYIDEIRNGRGNVLTTEPVLLLEPTSGSAGASKLIPYTATLRHEFQCGIAPWIHSLFQRHPGIRGGAAYWSISPPAVLTEDMDSVVPVGFEQDTDYLSGVGRWMARRIMAVPAELRLIRDLPTFQYVTLLFLLAESNLRLISVWNPTFLEMLLQQFREHSERLLADLKNGSIRPPTDLPKTLEQRLLKYRYPQVERARRLRALLVADEFSWPRVWPQLRLISCWTEAWAKSFLPAIEESFPGVAIQGKGLLATEAFVSLPYGEPAEGTAVLANRSHFFEFEEADGGSVRRADELEQDGVYSVIVTTGGGLYRYRLGDRVQVESFMSKTPRLRFLGRDNKVSDLTGEKLHETFVRKAVEEACRMFAVELEFFFVAPETSRGNRRYVLFACAKSKCDSERLAQTVEERLQESLHYRYSRETGQLGQLDLVLVTPAAKHLYVQRRAGGGGGGGVKWNSLETETGWIETLRDATATEEVNFVSL